MKLFEKVVVGHKIIQPVLLQPSPLRGPVAILRIPGPVHVPAEEFLKILPQFLALGSSQLLQTPMDIPALRAASLFLLVPVGPGFTTDSGAEDLLHLVPVHLVSSLGWWSRRDLNPQCQLAGLEVSQLTDDPFVFLAMCLDPASSVFSIPRFSTSFTDEAGDGFEVQEEVSIILYTLPLVAIPTSVDPQIAELLFHLHNNVVFGKLLISCPDQGFPPRADTG